MPDPILWFEGGPGGAATEEAATVSQKRFRDLHTDHDMVFVDQPGTGKSNALRCGDIGENPDNLDGYFGKLFPPKLVAACRAELEKKAHLGLYNTSIVADDLDDIRNALGYQQF
jgi:pimeloyl-ACP methyl ester carboxylesterase